MKYKIFVLLIVSFSCAYSQNGTGLIWDDDAYEQSHPITIFTKSPIPHKISYEKYCPDVKHQGEYNTCVGFACAYYLHTIIEAKLNHKTDRKSINQIALSPGYLYQKISNNDGSCKKGSKIRDAFEELKAEGVPLFNEFPYTACEKKIPSSKIKYFKISDYKNIFRINDKAEFKVSALKNALRAYPAIIGINVSDDFFYNNEKVWNPFNAKKTSMGHAVCVIGYDDDFETPRGKGAFRIVNSLGNTWKDKGYCWVPYQALGEVARYGFEVYPSTIIPKGQILSDDQQDISVAQNEISLIHSTQSLLNLLDNNNESPMPMFTMQKPLTHNEAFKIYLQNTQNVYLYAFGTDLTKNIYRIFPKNKDEKMLPSDIPRSTMLDSSITMDNTKGTDYIMIILSNEPLDANMIEKKLINTALAEPQERLVEALNNPKLPTDVLKVANGKVQFVLPEGYDLLPFLIKIDHQ